jgi:hypothetical protein
VERNPLRLAFGAREGDVASAGVEGSLSDSSSEQRRAGEDVTLE